MMAAGECPSARLARALKEYAARECKPSNNTTAVSVRMVVGFDSNLFHKKCHPASDAYDASIDFDLLATELFKDKEIWSSRDLIMIAMDDLSKLHGFQTKITRDVILCNRAGEAKTERNYLGGSLAAECPFKLKLKALVREPYKAKPDAKKWLYRDMWSRPVEIKEAHCVHGGRCVPGRQNRIMTVQRSGKYVEKLPDMALFTLCNHLEHRGKLSSAYIKSVLQPVWPNAKNVTKSDVFNTRVKVMRLLPTFRKTNGEYDEFKKVANANDMLGGIDSVPSLNDDEAYELAQSLWLEVESTATDTEEAIFSFIDYLELIKSRAKGFVYELARDTSGKKKKLLGVLWQTATMRRNFELFGGYLSLDMMKRGINTLLWLYVSAAMYDDARKLVLGCEGILCGETYDMYAFLSGFLAQHAPGRPLSSVLVVSGDGFFNQELARALGFEHAMFIADWFHLTDSGLTKRFGQAGKDLLEGHLMRMIRAESEQEFDGVHQAARELLQALPNRNGQLEADLEAFASDRTTYAQYCINQIPGNRGLHGSCPSEQNHSSALCFLNDGDKKGNRREEGCRHRDGAREVMCLPARDVRL